MEMSIVAGLMPVEVLGGGDEMARRRNMGLGRVGMGLRARMRRSMGEGVGTGVGVGVRRGEDGMIGEVGERMGAGELGVSGPVDCRA